MYTTRFLSSRETTKWLGRNGPVRSLRIQSYIEEQKRKTIEALEARNARYPLAMRRLDLPSRHPALSIDAIEHFGDRSCWPTKAGYLNLSFINGL